MWTNEKAAQNKFTMWKTVSHVPDKQFVWGSGGDKQFVWGLAK